MRARPAAHGHGHGGGHGTPHEAPWSMAIPLIVLAVGSVFAGYVGVPHALGGQQRDRVVPRAELRGEPVGAVAHGQCRRRRRAPAVAARQPRTEPAGRRGTRAGGRRGTELTLMGISVGIALAGIGIAVFFWLRNRAAGRRAGAPVRRPLPPAAEQVLRRRALRRGDRAADQAALDRRAVEGRRRRPDRRHGQRRRRARPRRQQRGCAALQTGSVRTYAAGLFLGVALILGWYLWL